MECWWNPVEGTRYTFWKLLKRPDQDHIHIFYGVITAARDLPAAHGPVHAQDAYKTRSSYRLTSQALGYMAAKWSVENSGFEWSEKDRIRKVKQMLW